MIHLSSLSAFFLLIQLILDAFELYGRKNYDYIKQTVEEVRLRQDGMGPKLGLRRPFDSRVGVFPSRSFNIGEQSVSYPHMDERNLALSRTY